MRQGWAGWRKKGVAEAERAEALANKSTQSLVKRETL